MIGSTHVCRACRAKLTSPFEFRTVQPTSTSLRRWALPTVESGQHRTLSHSSRPTPSLMRHATNSSRNARNSLISRPWSPLGISEPGKLQPFALQRRHQSTSPAGPIGPVPHALPHTDFNPTPDLLADTLDSAVLSSAAPPQWHFGYLRELGLDFGWGPTSMVEWLFEHVHVLAGSSFGVSILITAAIIRVCIVPTVIQAADTSAKLGALVELTKPIQDKMRVAAAERDQLGLQLARQELSKIYKDADIQIWRSFLPMIQLPIGFGSWRLLRNMADIPVPGMEVGGFWWFMDLTTYDPYFILPVATGLIQHLSMRLGGENGNMSEGTKKMRAVLLYVLPALTPLFIGFAPAAIQLSFCAAAILSFATVSLIRSPASRKFLNIAPIIKRAATNTVVQSPYQGSMTVSSRLTDHPAHLKAMQARTEAAPKRGFTSMNFRALRNPITAVRESMSEFMGDVMPTARGNLKSSSNKKAKSRAEDYEEKRSKEIEKAKMKEERQAKSRRRQW